MRFRTIPFLVALLSTTALSCGDITAPPRDERILLQTEHLEYQLTPRYNGRGTDIVLVYTNSLADTLYIENCNGSFGISLQQRDGNTWKTVWSPVIDSCLSQPIVIAPGAKFTKAIEVWASDAGTNSYPQFPRRDMDGIYRLQIWKVGKRHDGLDTSALVDVQYRSSNAFVLIDS